MADISSVYGEIKKIGDCNELNYQKNDTNFRCENERRPERGNQDRRIGSFDPSRTGSFVERLRQRKEGNGRTGAERPEGKRGKLYT